MFGCVRDLCVKERACLIACKEHVYKKCMRSRVKGVDVCPLKVCATDSKCVYAKRGVLDLTTGFEIYTQPEVCGL